jgi:5'(3')-deoxyribonucleotidase
MAEEFSFVQAQSVGLIHNQTMTRIDVPLDRSVDNIEARLTFPWQCALRRSSRGTR